jgi:hypothetical protein
LHANSSNCDNNHYSGRRSRRPTANADANSIALPNSVWRDPYADSDAYAHSHTNAILSANSKAEAVSHTQPDPLGHPDANSCAEPLALGFPDGKPAAVANAGSV